MTTLSVYLSVGVFFLKVELTEGVKIVKSERGSVKKQHSWLIAFAVCKKGMKIQTSVVLSDHDRCGLYDPDFKRVGADLQRQPSVLFLHLVCFQSVVFPLREAVSYIIRPVKTQRQSSIGGGEAELLEPDVKPPRRRIWEVRREDSSQQTVCRTSPGRKVNTWESWQPCGRRARGGGERLCQVYANHLPLRRHSFTWRC